ncbi:hypothetical protein PGT21_032339 [Puccinia graminis f. sp. tritici]|uniref:Uncharacterized protein n=1 Tax=Puccinia graminis f. sp. tritici TaxID=56615 RepID=A0A5B0QC33_PUCGR|nr:hypothetical protein PGT21_032339 [Puccinia graminis f. sp. tritici]
MLPPGNDHFVEAPTLSYLDHMRTQTHRRSVAEKEAREAEWAAQDAGAGAPQASVEPIPLDVSNTDEEVFDSIGMVESTTEVGSESEYDDPFATVDQSELTMLDGDEELAESAEATIDWDDYLFEAINQLVPDTVPKDFVKKRRMQVPSDSWYPFKSKEVIGSFDRAIQHWWEELIRTSFTVLDWLAHCGIHAPHNVSRRSRENIRKMLDVELRQTTSVFKNECYTLSVAQMLSHELSNPYVHPHLEFYPEECHGRGIYRCTQGSKWLKHLSPDLRVQMFANNKKHFYIFEPAQLITGEIVVPTFIYKEGLELYAKCAIPEMVEVPCQTSKHLQIHSALEFDSDLLVPINVSKFALTYDEIDMGANGMLTSLCSNQLWEIGGATTPRPLPNPWRIRAAGKVIRHMPINLYADDTSGNLSKRWNKHISFYCTLAGLPPQCAKMQYNCRFLATSNQAGVLELAEPIVDEINDIATNGSTAYDPALEEDVLVMSLVLCFQADSPMHAEVTNTFVPNVCLNPCRMCSLHLAKLDDKRKQDYVRAFVHINSSGDHSPVPSRSWDDIKTQTYQLWETAQDGVKCHFENGEKERGIRDTTNRAFVEIIQDKTCPELHNDVKALAEKDVERLFNSMLKLKVKYMTHDFMKSLKPPQLVEVLAAWQAFNVNSLNIESIQSKYLSSHFRSLVGKDFKIILQTAPFVLYRFMNESQITWWNSLLTLATYIFETRINNMSEYLHDLKKHINIFLCHSIRRSAQWVNKPKFHMLLHLPESIERFGPACLFSTENFESFNSVLRTASVHSNRSSPGRDLGLRFLNFDALRLILSRARICNRQTNKQFYAAECVSQIFSQNCLIQKSMGYNRCLLGSSSSFPTQIPTPLTKAEKVPIPEYFNQFPHSQVSQVSQLRLSDKDVLRKGFFCVLTPGGDSSKQVIGRAESLWQIKQPHRTRFVINLTHFCKKGISRFYRMRILEKTGSHDYYSVSDIKACLNIQHDCNSGRCQIIPNNGSDSKKGEGAPPANILVHSDDKQFILNSASLHSVVAHRQLASFHLEPISPLTWKSAIAEGMKEWASSTKARQTQKEAAASKIAAVVEA